MDDLARRVAEEIQKEKEWLPATAVSADTIVRAFTNAITRLANEDPAALSGAIAIIVQTGASQPCLVLSDPGTADLVAELRRYAEAGEKSPLARLLQEHQPL